MIRMIFNITYKLFNNLSKYFFFLEMIENAYFSPFFFFLQEYLFEN